MTKKDEIRKILLILLAIYLVLTIYSSVMFSQGRIPEEKTFLLAMSYAIFFSMLIYLVYAMIRIHVLKRDILRKYHYNFELLRQMKILYEMSQSVQLDDNCEVNKLKENIRKLEAELGESGNKLLNSKLLRKSEKERLKEMMN